MSILVPERAGSLRETSVEREISGNFLGRDEGFDAPFVILLIADMGNHWRGELSGRNMCEAGYQANR